MGGHYFTQEYRMTRSDRIDEQQRLDLQHQMWLRTFQGCLTTVAVPDGDGPILDIGSGTGAWAFAMATAFPLRRIIATDLTPPDVPTPSNVTFLRSNAEESWTFNESFSFIHGRMLSSGIRDWPKLLAQCFRHLEPGGLLELLDLCHPFQAENLLGAREPSELPTSDFLHWGRTAEKCWAVNGLDYRATEKHVARLQELGFEDIKEDTFRWPLGSWPEDEREARLGELNFRNFTTFITTAGTTIIRQDPKYSEEEAQKLVDAALKDLEENHLTRKFFLIIKVHTARKPESKTEGTGL